MNTRQQSQPRDRIQDQSQELGPNEHIDSDSSSAPPVKPRYKSPNICSNKICPQYKNTKYNTNNENNVQNLCSQCLKQYEKELYCLYCKQIYFDFTDDGKEWIMCDECERWVHTQCADILTNGVNTSFNCIKCRKIQQAPNPIRRPANRISLNNKVPERRKTQECMLNNFGFYWQLSPAELAEDVQKLKQFMR